MVTICSSLVLLEDVPIDEQRAAGEGVVAGEATLELLRGRRAAVEQVAAAVLEQEVAG